MSLKIVVLAKQVPDTCGASGHIQSGRLECLGAGAQIERHTSRFDGHYPDDGAWACGRDYS